MSSHKKYDLTFPCGTFKQYQLDSVKWPIHNHVSIFTVEHQSVNTLVSVWPPSAAVLQQSFATVAPPVTAQTTAAPHQDPGRPEKGTYTVRGSNGTACLMASMGVQLDVTFSTVQNKVCRKPQMEVFCLWVGCCEKFVFSLTRTDSAAAGEHSAQRDQQHWVMWRRQRHPEAHVCRSDQPHLRVHAGETRSSQPCLYDLLFVDRPTTCIFPVQFHQSTARWQQSKLVFCATLI